VLHLRLPLETDDTSRDALRAGDKPPRYSHLAELDVTGVSMGNPHAVAFVPDVAAVRLEVVGPQVEHHPAFPARTNFEVCEVLGRGGLRVRVWERGAGITLACGTGACAAVVAARLRGLVDDCVAVELPGGTLLVQWHGGDDDVFLTGPVAHVFDGTWSLS
jgi:diaminopimelate epimerase